MNYLIKNKRYEVYLPHGFPREQKKRKNNIEESQGDELTYTEPNAIVYLTQHNAPPPREPQLIWFWFNLWKRKIAFYKYCITSGHCRIISLFAIQLWATRRGGGALPHQTIPKNKKKGGTKKEKEMRGKNGKGVKERNLEFLIISKNYPRYQNFW